MSKFDTYKIKWQSSRYRDLVLYEEEYNEMRGEFTYIKSFRDEMIKLERWLHANKELDNALPKTQRGWVKQVRNWMRNAEQFAEEKYLHALIKGKVKSEKMSAADAGMRLSQILKRQQAAEARQKPNTPANKEAAPVAFGEALKMAGGKS